jgi:hypothetical protein
MAIKRDTPLSMSPEPKFTALRDSINPRKTWQQMSVMEKGDKKKELVSKGGIGRFNEYKDSISKDAGNRVNKQFEKNAATRGMTVEQLRKDNKKPSIGIDGLAGEKNTKSSLKSPCKGGTLTSCNK